MVKKKEKFVCPYCDKVFLRGSMGYGNHMKARHRSEYNYGRFNYTALPAAKWPFINLWPEEPVSTVKMVGLSDTEPVDLVNHPPHYTAGGVECIEAIQASMSGEQFRGYAKGCVLKYLWRWERKGGVEDLLKAEWYLKRLIRATGEPVEGLE